MGGVVSVFKNPSKIVTEPIRQIPGVGDPIASVLTIPTRATGSLITGDLGGVADTFSNPFSTPSPPPPPPPKEVPPGWSDSGEFCELSTPNLGTKDPYDCSAICNDQGLVWAQVHNNTCKCGDASACINRTKVESSYTKMLLVNVPEWQKWVTTQHADIVNGINNISTPYTNESIVRLDELIERGYELALPRDTLTDAESLRAHMLDEISFAAEEKRREEERIQAQAALEDVTENTPSENESPEPPEHDSVLSSIGSLLGFDDTKIDDGNGDGNGGDSNGGDDNGGDGGISNQTLVIVFALFIGIVLLVIRKGKKRRRKRATNNVLLK